MLGVAFLFYMFAFLAIVSAFCVISTRNPVYAVLSLIFCFFNAAGIFMLLGAEFLAMLLVIVYVGAVAVLFLFVVMMLNVNTANLKDGLLKYLPIGASMAVVLFFELYAFMRSSISAVGSGIKKTDTAITADISNTKQIGMLLYTDYGYIFQLSGLVLFVAMIGAIVLTLRHSETVKRQKISKQVSRTQEESVQVVKVKSGSGI